MDKEGERLGALELTGRSVQDRAILDRDRMVRCVRLPRPPFWYVASIAIVFLFWGQGPIFIRMQHNWVGTLILLGVSFFYNGRPGFTQQVVRENRISNKTRIVLRVLAVTTFLLGILIEVFLSFVPSIILIPLVVFCVCAAPTCLYISLRG